MSCRRPAGVAQRIEVIGTFLDLGRLEPDDPRVEGLPIERLSNSLLQKVMARHWRAAGHRGVIRTASWRIDERNPPIYRPGTPPVP